MQTKAIRDFTSLLDKHVEVVMAVRREPKGLPKLGQDALQLRNKHFYTIL